MVELVHNTLQISSPVIFPDAQACTYTGNMKETDDWSILSDNIYMSVFLCANMLNKNRDERQIEEGKEIERKREKRERERKERREREKERDIA